MKRRDNVEDIYPLSPVQEGILFHNERYPESADYWNKVTCRIRGDLDTDKLQRAWQSLVDRHAALRTRITRNRQGRALQVVSRKSPLSWASVDLTTTKEEQLAPALSEYLSELDNPPCLDRGPLLRVGVYQLHEDEYCLAMRYHHIILDGWSEGLLWDEVWATYNDLQTGNPRDAALETPYSTYIAWQQGQDPEANLTFWRNYLRDFIPAPSDSEPVAASYDSADLEELQFALDSSRSEQLRLFAQQNRLTMNSILQCAWALVLAAENGRPDVVFGTVFADRAASIDGIDSIVGVLLATLPVRLQTDTSLGVVDWIASAQHNINAIAAHTAVSLGQIQKYAGLGADEPLVNSLFAYEVDDKRVEEYSLGGELTIHSWDRAGSTGYPLSVVATGAARIEFRVSFDCNWFSESWCKRALARMDTLLDRICRHPQVPVSQLSLLTTTEIDSRHSRSQYDQKAVDSLKPIDQVIADIATVRGDDVAVLCRDNQLTYRELMERSAEIAGLLSGNGIAPGARVGVLLDRSLDLIPGILAIWRVGAVYVPFDPSHPVARMRAAAKQADISVFVTDNAVLPTAKSLGSIINIDAPESAVSSDRSNHSESLGPAIAYLFFTSGSTGEPNGVPIRHFSLSNLMESMIARPGFEPDDGLLAATTVAFDISLVELFLPLVAGGRVQVATRELVADTGKLAGALHDEAITVQQATPAMWEMLILSGWQGKPNLRILCAGDTLRPDLADKLRSRGLEVWNLYGPTETTVMSTLAPVLATRRITVGQPIANTLIRIIDSAERELPHGVSGELCIGGAGLAPGYFENSAITAKRFAELPDTGGVRTFFRTGDLAWIDESGEIVHQGRIDRQIKLRGFRIEPGEIEAALNTMNGIATSCVVLRHTRKGDARIVAYVVPDASTDLVTSVVKDRLAKYVPEYMLPSAFVYLEALPLTASGKVDQRALPEPDHRQSDTGTRKLTATEELVAAVWSELLDRDVADSGSDFIRLGGHSLMVARLSKRLADSFCCPVSIGDLLENTTLSAQGLLIDTRCKNPQDRHETRSIIKPVSFGQDPVLSGVYHPAVGNSKNHGILIAGPLLNEAIRTHFALRLVAQRCAGRGYDVLRFDFAGTGDSEGDLENLSPIAWVNDVEAAAQYLKQVSGCAEMSIFAIRFAAHIAARATKHLSVNRFVTWDPLFAGQHWADDLLRSQRMIPDRLRRHIDLSCEIQGHSVMPNFLQEVNAMGAIEPRAAHIIHKLSEGYEHASTLPFGTEDNQTVPRSIDWAAKTSRIAFSSELLDTLCQTFS